MAGGTEVPHEASDYFRLRGCRPVRCHNVTLAYGESEPRWRNPSHDVLAGTAIRGRCQKTAGRGLRGSVIGLFNKALSEEAASVGGLSSGRVKKSLTFLLSI